MKRMTLQDKVTFEPVATCEPPALTWEQVVLQPCQAGGCN